MELLQILVASAMGIYTSLGSNFILCLILGPARMLFLNNNSPINHPIKLTQMHKSYRKIHLFKMLHNPKGLGK